jgi:hypothetical protein
MAALRDLLGGKHPGWSRTNHKDSFHACASGNPHQLKSAQALPSADEMSFTADSFLYYPLGFTLMLA